MENYCFLPDGRLLIADGVNRMKVWDGLLPEPVDAGIPAPATGPGISIQGMTPGTILGTYKAYFRYVDPLGQVSDFSPVGGPLDAFTLSSGITTITVQSPVLIESTAHGLTTGNKITISDQIEINGDWVITVVNANQFTLDDSSESVFSGTPNVTGQWKAGASTLAYTLPAPPSPTRAVTTQVLRNTAHQLTTFYVDAEVAIAVTSTTSTKDDETLAAQKKESLFNPDGSLNAMAHGVPPNFQSVLAYQQGRVFAAVNAVVKDGAVAVTNGSTTVKGLGTNWKTTLAGRNLYVNAATKAYLISSVDATAQTLTLSSAYGDATQPYVLYSIRPGPAYRRLIYYSEAQQPESMPATNTVPLPEDGDELTGLMCKGSFIYFLEQRHILRYTFQTDPAHDGQIYLAAERGCVNQRCWVQVEDQAMMLDQGGIHAFGGGQEIEPLSTDVQQLFRAGSKFGINWNAAESFHAAADVATEIVRWFVALGGNESPRHAITYHYRLKRWSVESYPFAVGASMAGYVNGLRAVIAAGEAGRCWTLDRGQLDGIDPRSPYLYGAVTSASTCSLTAENAAFTTAVVGLPVYVIAGKGKGQSRRIVSVSAATLIVQQPWRVKPDSTSVYQIGGVPFQFRTAQFGLPAGDGSEAARSFGMYWTPTKAPGTLNLEFFYDADEEAQASLVTHPADEGFVATEGYTDLVADMMRRDGFAQQRIDGRREQNLPGARQITFDISGVANGDGLTISQIELEGVAN